MKFLIRYRFAIIFVVGALLLAGGLVLEKQRRADARRAVNSQIAVRGSLGPTPGPDADGYIADKRKVLTSLAAASPSTKASGLVSLSRFVAAGEVPSPAKAIFVRFPGSEPEALQVSGTVAEAVAGRAAEVQTKLRSEATALEDLARTDKANASEHTRSASEKRSTANSATVGCSCVYAYLTTLSSLGDLESLSDDPRVRFVDVTQPPRADLTGWELRPVLPKGAS